MSPTRILALMWSVAFVATVHDAHAGILAQVIPVRYSITGASGERAARDIVIVNQGAEAVVVRVRLSDWALSEQAVTPRTLPSRRKRPCNRSSPPRTSPTTG